METIDWVIICAVMAFIGYAVGSIIGSFGRIDEDEKLIQKLATIINKYEKEINKMKSEVTKEQPQWIRVEDRMPDSAFGCLATVWDNNVYGDCFLNLLPYFVGWDGEQWNDYDGEECPFEVYAWMPLPKPPEEVKTDG